MKNESGKIDKPFISVVMGCYNNETTIKEAVNSILDQSLADFEFIIVDDCSTDGTIDVVRSIQDPRIKLIINSENKGLGYSLNYGVNLSKGKYIARMDADDIAMPRRFEEQVKYLEEHPEVMCVGTGAEKIGSVNLYTQLFSRYIIPRCTQEEIKAWLLLGTPLLHPSVMMNATLVKRADLNYDPAFRKAQDYELWTRMIWVGEVRNIRKPLMKYRYSAFQSSSKDRSSQITSSQTMYNRMFCKLLGRTLTADEMRIHILFATKNRLNPDELSKVEQWLSYLLPYVEKTTAFDKVCIADMISRRRATICRDSLNYINRFFHYFRYSSFHRLRYLIYLLRP